MEHSSTENERFWVGVNLLDDPEVPKSLFTPASFTFDGDEAHMRSSNAVDPHVREAMADLLAGLAGDVDGDGAPCAPSGYLSFEGFDERPWSAGEAMLLAVDMLSGETIADPRLDGDGELELAVLVACRILARALSDSLGTE